MVIALTYGDFNTRIEELEDFLVDVDIIPKRQVLDPTKNKHGEAFIDFLLASKLCVLNGRITDEDNFTCIKKQGRSVVDYFITSTDSVKYAKHMYVKTVIDVLDDIGMLPTCTEPDHSVLILDINLSDYNVIDKYECTLDVPSNSYNKNIG